MKKLLLPEKNKKAKKFVFKFFEAGILFFIPRRKSDRAATSQFLFLLFLLFWVSLNVADF